MIHGIFLLLPISVVFGAIAPVLPNNAIAYAVQTGPTGNIYVAGSYTLSGASSSHAFVAELTPAMSVMWWTPLAGSKQDVAVALALGSDGSIYVTGNTESPDFPTTPGAMQSAMAVNSKAYAVKLNPAGVVVYSTFVGGSAATTGQGIAVDGAGDAFITGSLGPSGVFPATPTAVIGATGTIFPTAYIVELNAAGSSAVVAIQGFGGEQIALDGQGNIYAAGAFEGPLAPTTAGAFQSTAGMAACYPISLAGAGSFPRSYQHIAKIDSTGTRLIFATYLNGAFGAVPTGTTVDASGNVIVAGTTNSANYPTTPGAYQPEFFANPVAQPASVLIPLYNPPPNAGYVTKLNSSGTGLVWSTFLAGSSATLPNSSNVFEGDKIGGMALDASGNILIAGLAYSADFPGLWSVPVASRPTLASPKAFVTRLSADGSTLSATQLLGGSGGPIAAQADGTAVVGGAKIASVSLPPVGRVAAITDSADDAKLVSVAPGQLLTLYGADLAPATPGQPANGFPAPFNGVTVTFNGIAAPILYTSSTQINLQVPYEISGQSQVTMQLTSQFASQPLSESYILAVVSRQPSIFLSPAAYAGLVFAAAACNGQTIEGLQPLALNADGTLNSCANPAAPGSTVTIFLNGVGAASPAQATGAVSGSAEPLTPSAVLAVPQKGVGVGSTETLPGSIDAVAQVQLTLSSTAVSSSVLIALKDLQGAQFLVRGTGAGIWVGPTSASHRRPGVRR